MRDGFPRAGCPGLICQHAVGVQNVQAPEAGRMASPLHGRLKSGIGPHAHGSRLDAQDKIKPLAVTMAVEGNVEGHDVNAGCCVLAGGKAEGE